MLRRPKHSMDKLSPTSSVHAPPRWPAVAPAITSGSCLSNLPLQHPHTHCDTHLPSAPASPFGSSCRGLLARSSTLAGSPQDDMGDASWGPSCGVLPAVRGAVKHSTALKSMVGIEKGKGSAENAQRQRTESREDEGFASSVLSLRPAAGQHWGK